MYYLKFFYMEGLSLLLHLFIQSFIYATVNSRVLTLYCWLYSTSTFILSRMFELWPLRALLGWLLGPFDMPPPFCILSAFWLCEVLQAHLGIVPAPNSSLFPSLIYFHANICFLFSHNITLTDSTLLAFLCISFGIKIEHLSLLLLYLIRVRNL